MFCSKCGKQIADDAAFCEGCGNPTASVTNTATQAAPQVVYVQQAAAPTSAKMTAAIPTEEKETKFIAIGMFLVLSVLTLGFMIALVASEGRMIFSMVGNVPEWAMDNIWKELSGIFVFLMFLYIACQVFTGFMNYFSPYIKRNFEEKKKQVIGSCISDALMSGIMPIALGVVTAEETDGDMPVFLILIAILLLALCIITAILYNKAANVETYNKYKESRIEKCGEANSTLSKLAKLNGSEEQSAPKLWLCNSCGTKNSSTEFFCKGCGKYK